jgi:hypothetical protein
VSFQNASTATGLIVIEPNVGTSVIAIDVYSDQMLAYVAAYRGTVSPDKTRCV